MWYRVIGLRAQVDIGSKAILRLNRIMFPISHNPGSMCYEYALRNPRG